MNLESFVRDLRFALRGLRRHPSFSLAAVGALTVAIGANTAVFSVVSGVLLKPLPYPESENLAVVWLADEGDGDRRLGWPVPLLRDVAGTSRTLSSMVGYASQRMTLTGMGDPEFVPVAALTSGILGTFGMFPEVGRDLLPEEAVPGAPKSAVVSHRFWKERFGGDVAALSRVITLAGEAYEVVGVAPERFDYPRGTQIWIPGQWKEEVYHLNRFFLGAVGRLAPGADLSQARMELDGHLDRLAAARPEMERRLGARPLSLIDQTVGPVRVGLVLLMSAVALILLIACANVANLLLARGALREGEMTVRRTLGARRRDLARMLFTESLLLSAVGGLLGVLLALWGVQGLRAWQPSGMPRVESVTVDGPVLLFAAAVTLLVTILQSGGPTLYLLRRSPSANLSQERSGASGVLGRGIGRSALMALEVGLSLVLVLGASLLMKSFAQVSAVELGFDPRDVVEFNLTLPESVYGPEETVGFFQALEERLLAIPGMEAVGAVYGSPLGRLHWRRTFTAVDGRQTGEGEPEPWLLIRTATPGYLRAVGLSLRGGRWFDSGDRSGSPPVTVVSQGTADRLWPGEDPIGRQIAFHEGTADGPWTVVGVVGNVRSQELTQEPALEAYFPHAQWSRTTMTLLLKGGTQGADLGRVIRREVSVLDSNLAPYEMQSMEDRIEALRGTERFYLLLLGAFALIASALASLGLYGVVSYMVSRRTREIGVRVALGATRGSIARLVLGQGFVPAGVGIAAGLGAALIGGRLMSSLLYQVEPWDPAAYILAVAGLGAITILALVIPARRATRIPPTEAIKGG